MSYLTTNHWPNDNETLELGYINTHRSCLLLYRLPEPVLFERSTRIFTAVFTRAIHPNLSSASRNQFTQYLFKYVLILSYLCLSSPMRSLLFNFSNQNFVSISYLTSFVLNVPHISFTLVTIPVVFYITFGPDTSLLLISRSNPISFIMMPNFREMSNDRCYRYNSSGSSNMITYTSVGGRNM
jgi:hypothetical protein